MAAQPSYLIAGNWKMHGARSFAEGLAGALAGRMGDTPPGRFELLLCPPAPLLAAARAAIGEAAVLLGGQDCHPRESGAHTGDISAEMLADAGCSHVIVGHSERRGGHGESDSLVRDKAAAGQRAGLVPVICVGETLQQREAGDATARVVAQLRGSIPSAAPSGPPAGPPSGPVVIAYEPVWAIGTGHTPTTDDVAAVHGAIRDALDDLVADAGRTPILYGGSVKPDNAGAMLAVPDVDGVLVGGASLDAEGFWAIAQACP